MYFSSIEGFGVEGDRCRVAALGTADGDFPPKFHPWHGQDGAGVGARKCEHVLLVVLQQVQNTWEERGDGLKGRELLWQLSRQHVMDTCLIIVQYSSEIYREVEVKNKKNTEGKYE